MTEEKILDVIRSYYPFGIESGTIDSTYDQTKEFKKLDSVLAIAEKAQSKWFEYEEWLKAELPNCFVQEKTFTHLFNFDPCYRTSIDLPSKNKIHSHIVIHLGLLTNHYAIYLTELRDKGDSITVFNPYTADATVYEEKALIAYPEASARISKASSNQTLEETNRVIALKTIDIALNELLKRYPQRINFPKDLVNKIIPNVARTNTLLNCTTYFNLLFTDHIF